MMRLRLILPTLIFLTTLCYAAMRPAIAQSDGITLVPDKLSLQRTLPADSVAGTLRLSVSQPISKVALLVSDLQGVDSSGQQLDPIPASSITILPALQFDSLAANSITQVSIQLIPPPSAGVYTGTLLLRWQQPTLGEATVPIRLHLRTRPALTIHDPADPAGLTIYAIKGAPVERNLLLRETSGGATIHELRALTQDLIDSANHQVLSGRAVRVDPINAQINPGDLLTATVHITLDQAAAGDYKGNLTLVAAPDVLLTVPLALQVRHHWLWPLLVVSAGVLLGLGLSNYQTQGRVRDEYVVRIANVHDALKADSDLQASFGKRLHNLLAVADDMVRAAKWSEAETVVAEAETVLTKWRKQAEDWKAQLTHLRTQLVKRLQSHLASYKDQAHAPTALRKLEQAAADLIENAVDCATPSELRNKISDLEDKFTLFVRVERELQELVALREKLDPTKVDRPTDDQWRAEEQRLAAKLNSLPAELDAMNALGAEIAAQADRVRQYIEENPTQLKDQQFRAVPTPSSTADLGEPGVFLPGLSAGSAYDPDKARRRLRQNSKLLYCLAALVLIAVGMSTLYAPNLTFGANLLSDYFALFVFGLGSQTTLTSVTELLQRWGVPFGK